MLVQRRCVVLAAALQNASCRLWEIRLTLRELAIRIVIIMVSPLPLAACNGIRIIVLCPLSLILLRDDVHRCRV